MPGDEDQQPADEPGTEFRTIRVGQWRHKTVDGRYRISRFGDEVELPADEVERGDRQGVFTPTAPTSTRSPEVDRALASVVTRLADPDGAEGSDAATLHHDITNRDQQLAAGAVDHFLDVADRADEPADPPAATDTPDGPDSAAQTPQDSDSTATAGDGTSDADSTAPEPPKRPAKAASVAVWRAYIAAIKPELADEVAGMDKDELQAQAPKDD